MSATQLYFLCSYVYLQQICEDGNEIFVANEFFLDCTSMSDVKILINFRLYFLTVCFVSNLINEQIFTISIFMQYFIQIRIISGRTILEYYVILQIICVKYSNDIYYLKKGQNCSLIQPIEYYKSAKILKPYKPSLLSLTKRKRDKFLSYQVYRKKANEKFHSL